MLAGNKMMIRYQHMVLISRQMGPKANTHWVQVLLMLITSCVLLANLFNVGKPL